MDKNKKLFPQRLWELIHDEKYNFCLRWSPDGQRVYLNRNEFEAHYLKTPNNQFHTQKAISFVRQMNMYGFRKVDDCYYENDNFKRDCQHLLKNMVRRHSSKCFLAGSTSDLSGLSQHSVHAGLVEHQLQNQQLTSPVARSASRMNSPPNNNSNRHHHHHHHHLHHQQQQRQQQQQQAQTGGANHFGDSIGNLGAALAAISSNNQNAFRGPQQASSLYHRLAALNFGGQINGTQAVNQQQQRTAATLMMVPCNNNQQQMTQEHQHNHNNQNQQQQQQDYVGRARLLLDQTPRDGAHYNGLDIPMGVQESMTIRQALQHDLFRSFLQLNKQQSTAPFLSQQLSQTQQQLSSNLLLESLANLTRANLVAQAARDSNDDTGLAAAAPLAPLGSLLLDQTLLGPLMNRATAFNPINVDVDVDVDVDDDDDDNDGDNYPIDYEDDLPNGTGSSRGAGVGGDGGGGNQYSSSSTSSTNNEHVRYQQEQFVEDTVLDLAKPSITRSDNSRNVSPRG